MEAEKKAFKITKREIGFVLGIVVFLLVNPPRGLLLHPNPRRPQITCGEIVPKSRPRTPVLDVAVVTSQTPGMDTAGSTQMSLTLARVKRVRRTPPSAGQKILFLKTEIFSVLRNRRNGTQLTEFYDSKHLDEIFVVQVVVVAFGEGDAVDTVECIAYARLRIERRDLSILVFP